MATMFGMTPPMPEPGDKAQQRHFGEIGRIGGPEGEHAEQQVGGDQRGLAAIAVADPAENLRTEQHADIAGAEHQAERLRRHVPLRDQVRRGKGDGADVVAVDHRHQDRPDDQLDLERADPVLVQKMRNLNFRFAGHRFLPQEFFCGENAASPPGPYRRSRVSATTFELVRRCLGGVRLRTGRGLNATEASVVSKRNVNVSWR